MKRTTIIHLSVAALFFTNNFASGGFVASYNPLPPTIDGVLGVGEWGAAYPATMDRADGGGQHNVGLHFQHDGTSLYVGVDSQWGSGWDVVWDVLIDGDHSKTINGNLAPPYVDINICRPSPTGYPGYVAYYTLRPPSEGTSVGFGSGAASASGGSGNVFYEFRVPLADLDVNVVSGDTAGIFVSHGYDGITPHLYNLSGSTRTTPENWATLRLIPEFAEPPQPARPDPTPPPPSSKSNLVVVTHGWVSPFTTRAAVLGGAESLGSAITAALDPGDWDVYVHSWLDEAETIFPTSAYSNALEEGRRLGKHLADGDYDSIHFIAHSAGSALISTASEWVAKDTHPTTIQTTFLDPYLPLGARELYGGAADWADNYFSYDLETFGLTQGGLPNAHNVDVTGLDPALLSSHGWPLDWYRRTVDGIDLPAGSGGYGFPLSVEGGGWDPSVHPDGPPAYPVGNDPVVLGGGSSEPTDIVVRHDTVLNVLDQLRANSSSGTVNVAGTGFSMLTGSPVWMTTLVETDDIVNFLTFEADFTSDPGAEGLLAVFWENELLGLIDERYVLDGMQEYTMFLPGNFEPGAYALSFRLDPYTVIDSSVLIDNVATGFVTPEPATLSLLALGGLALLRRRSKQ